MTNGFKIIGISCRTSNQNNQAQQDLGKLWQQFFSENIAARIPNKIASSIFAVYTDYKSNFTEEYTTIIGFPVASLDEVPEGFVGREFPSENFQKFTAKGEMPAAIASTWQDIWKKDNELNRKYTYDFELYDEKSQQGENSEVAIFIAIQ